MVAKIGHPTIAPDFTGLTILPTSFLANEIGLHHLRSTQVRALLGQAVDRTEWQLSPLTVNAIYDPTANDVTLPAALLASPFLGTSRSTPPISGRSAASSATR